VSTDSQPVEPRGGTWSTLATVLALGWCAFRLGHGIGPRPAYGSDFAVPILLTRGLGDGPFTLFYPGQDRYGMWPYLAARWLGLDSPEAFHLFSVLVLCSAVLPLWRLLRSPALAVLTLFAPLALSPLVAESFFDGQPYLWQVVAILWAWVTCRSALEAKTRWTVLVSLGVFMVSGVLAAWVSTLSILGLLGILVVEGWEGRARPLRVGVTVLASCSFGSTEAALRSRHAAYSRKEFGTQFATHLPIDQGHLMANVASVVSGAWTNGVVLPLLLAVGALAVPRRARQERVNLVLMLWLAVCTLPALVAIAHFRINQFSPRYFCFPAFWAIAAATYGALTLLERLRWPRGALAAIGLLVALALFIPGAPRDPLAAPRMEAARLLGPEPRVLLGGYWDVYVPASLAPRGALLPLPTEGEFDRFPALQSELRPGRPALAPCALAGPDGTLRQYGALLRRTADAPVIAGGARWCLHEVERPARTFLEERTLSR
jgi:hypothetical protein